MDSDNRQVCWTTVLEFVQRQGIDPTSVLTAGTPRWADLDDSDPEKTAAVLAAGVHHALRLDVAQQDRADASKAIAGAEDWSAIARQIRRGRGTAYIHRRKEGAA